MKKLNTEKVRKALSLEIHKTKWKGQVKPNLRLAKIPPNNFYLFLKGERGMTDKSLTTILRVFQMDVNKYYI